MEPITKRALLSIHQPVPSLNKFPPEMLEIIFGNSRTTELLNLRQVNHQWNDVSLRVLRERNDIHIRFKLLGGIYMKTSRHRCSECSLNLTEPPCTLGTRSLIDLVAFLTKSPLFPGTSFRFDDLSNESCEGLTSFLTIWGSRVSSLKVSTSDSAENVKILLNQLLGRIPNLKEFKVLHDWDILSPVSSSILSSTLTMADSQFQLTKLEVFCVSDSPRKYSQIVGEILTASPNLKRFSMADRTVLPRDLEMLHRSNKLHCLKELKICITEDLIAHWKNSPVFPNFEQLRKLRLQPDNLDSLYVMLPLSFDWLEKFANMKELDTRLFYGTYDVLLADSLKTLPTIETLQVSLNRNTAAFGELIKRTPNVKTLIIRDDHSFWMAPVQYLNFKEIAKYLPKLETFCWQLRAYVSLRYKFDALISGLPEQFCKEKAVELRDEDSLNATEVSRYRLQCNPSILNLKELRNLDITFVKSAFYLYTEDDDDIENGSMNRDKAGFDSDSAFYRTGLTKVSKLFASRGCSLFEINKINK